MSQLKHQWRRMTFHEEQIQLHITNSHLTYGFVCTPPVCQTTWNYPRATWKDGQTVITHTQKIPQFHQSFNVDFDVDVNLFYAKRSRISNTTPITVNRLRPIWLLQFFKFSFPSDVWSQRQTIPVLEDIYLHLNQFLWVKCEEHKISFSIKSLRHWFPKISCSKNFTPLLKFTFFTPLPY